MAISDQVTRIKGAKAALKEAIESKGVTVGDGRIDTYAEKVLEIPQGGGGGYQPQESLTILQNGEYNMIHDTDKFYNPVHVEVPQPSGTTNITQNGEHDVTQYERANVQVPEIHNAFKVATLVERDALQNVQDGDICVVQQSSIENMTESTSENVSSVFINPTVILPEAFQTQCYESFVSETADTRIDINIRQNSAYISIDNYDTGLYTSLSFTSLDGITYTTQDISQSTLYELVEEVNSRRHSVWNDAIGYFLQVKTVEFPGVYKASVDNNTVTWEYLNIGINRKTEDILLNKKVYTSSGTITGTRDMKKYAEKGYLVSLTEPEDHEAYPLWVEPYNDYNYTNDRFLNHDINKNYYKIKERIVLPSPTIFTNTTDKPSSFIGFYNNAFYFSGITDNSSTPKIRKINLSDGSLVDVASYPTLSYSASEADWSQNVMVGNKIYFIPYRHTDTSFYSSNLFYEYNIDTDTFSQKANLPQSIFRYYGMFIHSTSNSIIVKGNYGTGSSAVIKWYKYSISNNTWTTINTSSLTQEEQEFIAQSSSFEYYRIFDSTNHIYHATGSANFFQETTNAFKILSYVNYNSYFKYSFNNKLGGLYSSYYTMTIKEHKILKIDNLIEGSICVFDVLSFDNNTPVASNIKRAFPMDYTLKLDNPHYCFLDDYNNLIIYTQGTDFKYKILKYNLNEFCNSPVANWNSTIFTLEELPDVNTTFNGYKYIDLFNPPNNAKITACYIDERFFRNNSNATLYRNNMVKKVYLYNRDSEQYEIILDYSSGPDPDAPQLLSITDIVYNPLDNEGGNSLAPYMLTMNFDKAVTPQNWNMYLRANGQSQQISMYSGSGTTSFKLMFEQPDPDWISGTTVELYIEPGALVDNDTGTHEFEGVQTTLGIIPPTTVTVSFDSNGGSSVADRTVMYGSPCQPPSNPTRTNYTFNGWLYNGSAWDFNTPVTHSMTLTASWTYVPQEVTPSGVAFNGEKIIYSFTDPSNENHIVLYLPYESRITTVNGNKVYQMRLTDGAYCRVYNDYGHSATFGYTVKPTITIGGQTVSYTEWVDYSANWNHALSRTDNGAWITIPSLNGSQATVELGTSTYFSSNGSTKVFNTTISAPHME